ncbi:hypothetical protein C8R44DRAFT_740005 [Mycena epipterygia]|nr:hypothetical protein C8R44DRAFT_740005 [Mycena epipterygia]
MVSEAEKSAVDKDRNNHAFSLLNFAKISVPIGAPKQEVKRNLDLAWPIFQLIGIPRTLQWCDSVLADLELRDGNISGAYTFFQKCLKASLGKDVDVVTYALVRLADQRCWNLVDWTPTWTTVFLVYVLKSYQKLEIFKALQFLGDVFLAQDDQDTATSLLTVALEGVYEARMVRG